MCFTVTHLCCDTMDSDTTVSIHLEKFHDWIHCICVVNFDLELGQSMEVSNRFFSFAGIAIHLLFMRILHFSQEVYPPNVVLTEEDKTNICYLAFPDSNSSCLGDTQFHIRVKQCSTSSSLSPCHTTYNKTCPVFLRINPHFFFGFVYFRQIKDVSLPRGYFQKVSEGEWTFKINGDKTIFRSVKSYFICVLSPLLANQIYCPKIFIVNAWSIARF